MLRTSGYVWILLNRKMMKNKWMCQVFAYLWHQSLMTSAVNVLLCFYVVWASHKKTQNSPWKSGIFHLYRKSERVQDFWNIHKVEGGAGQYKNYVRLSKNNCWFCLTSGNTIFTICGEAELFIQKFCTYCIRWKSGS